MGRGWDPALRKLSRPRFPVLLALILILYFGREMGDLDSRCIGDQSGCIGCMRAVSSRTTSGHQRTVST